MKQKKSLKIQKHNYFRNEFRECLQCNNDIEKTPPPIFNIAQN